MNKNAAIGFVAGAVIVGGAIAWYVTKPPPTIPCSESNYPPVGTTAIVNVSLDALGNPQASPNRCLILPGGWIKWNFDSKIKSQFTRFGTDPLGPKPDDESADANGGIAFKTDGGANTAPSFSIKGTNICKVFPYMISANGGTPAPNPAIIIKPGSKDCL